MPETKLSVRVERRDHPTRPAYWQTFVLAYEPGLNVTSVLQRIAAHPVTPSGEQVAPVAYESGCLEEVCGSCTVLINGRVRQACSALIDRLLEEDPTGIELRPMSKFPVIRDLWVDRYRLFRALHKLECWIPVDTCDDRGSGPRQTVAEQGRNYPLSQCISCGCCLEACPQYQQVPVTRRENEPADVYQQRLDDELDQHFFGAAPMSQAVLMNAHPIGKTIASRRIETMTSAGGIQNCGKAGNCQAVCPKRIPLMESWARANRAATVHAIRQFFEG